MIVFLYEKYCSREEARLASRALQYRTKYGTGITPCSGMGHSFTRYRYDSDLPRDISRGKNQTSA